MAIGGNMDTARVPNKNTRCPRTRNLASAKAAGVPSARQSTVVHRATTVLFRRIRAKGRSAKTVRKWSRGGTLGKSGGSEANSLVGFRAVRSCQATGRRQNASMALTANAKNRELAPWDSPRLDPVVASGCIPTTYSLLFQTIPPAGVKQTERGH